MLNTLRWAALAIGLGSGLAGVAWAEGEAPAAPAPSATPMSVANTSTADHSKFEILQQDFASGPAVTAACVSCHTEADDQVMHSIHFTWEYESDAGQTLGKSTVINAFCGSVAGNEPRCTSCHAGYGWTDMSVSPVAQSVTVDCLVCHDRSGQYTKSAAGAGNPPLDPVAPGTPTITGRPAWPVDLAKSAQSVGQPGRDNCGNCHFYGGGGDNVKHGDLSSVLFNPPLEIDVHMSPDGANMSCSTCHVSDQHQWAGSRYDMTAADHPDLAPGAARVSASCESCHSETPHPSTLEGFKLNDHVDVVACQTCHIPAFARGGVATKTLWDWSTAGRMGDDGKPMAEGGYTQGDGRELHTYMTQKGSMDWAEDVAPMYAWFDGSLRYTTGDLTIDPTQVVEINRVDGAAGDGVSRIWPFKQMRGRQAYDTGLNKLVYTHVFGPQSDTAYWKVFDWDKAIAAGMKAAGSDYSGSYDFVDTYMYWPITHMVPPADAALDCAACHAEDGRMASIAGVYMPGTDPNSPVGWLGRLILLATVLGVVGHGVLRLVTRKNGGSRHG